MASRKAHEVESYLARPDDMPCVILLYGPDRGLVSERAAVLAKASGADLADPFATIKLDADLAASDPSRVADEAHTVSMFAGKRLVWISGQTQKALLKALDPLLATPAKDAMVIVEAGDLRPTAPLRKTLEKSPNAMVLPCYQDDARALARMIDSELQISGLNMHAEARSFLTELLGDDRMASRAEVRKLCIYCQGQDQIETADIEAIVGDAGELAIETVIDAAATGAVDRMQHMARRLLTRGTSATALAIALQRHFQLLHAARARMDAQGQSAASVAGALRPPVNFKRKSVVVEALGIWPLERLTRVLQRVDKVSLDIRANDRSGPALLTTALLAIALEARSLARR